MTATTTTKPDSSILSLHFVIGWLVCLLFYYLEYAVRSAPAVMIPELSAFFGVSTVGLGSIIGSYYYAYAAAGLLAGLSLDKFGAKYVVPAGVIILGIGCLLFAVPVPLAGYVGRALQGLGSAFAFTGSVYLAVRGLKASRLATAIGITQCLGMLGAYSGQAAVAPLIHGTLSVESFWFWMGIVIFINGVVLCIVTPRENLKKTGANLLAVLEPFKVVFTNPQSYLCGLTAGLLFTPTTIFDMIWCVRFLQQDRGLSYEAAVHAASMVPLGWVLGCPLFGWIADSMQRRKPALMLGIGMILLCFAQLNFATDLLPTWLTLFLLGIASGSAMIPYTVMKETNPDRVKGSATGAMNFLTFSISAIIGPIFASHFGTPVEGAADRLLHFTQVNEFWLAALFVALLVATLLKETGAAAKKVDILAVA